MPRITAHLKRRPATLSGERSRSGSTLIESAIVMVLLCLVLFGAIQVSMLYAGQEVLDYAASMGARSRSVGFNDFMVHKVMRVASIPNAGRIENPVTVTSTANPVIWETYSPGALVSYSIRAQPTAPQIQVERSRIPLYLGSERWGKLGSILDYENWDDIRLRAMTLYGEDEVLSRVHQRFPLRYPMHRAFYRGDYVDMEGEARMDNHFSLYLE